MGDLKTTTLGERPVVVVRSGLDEVSVVENRCAHPGVKFCQVRFGHATELLCPYHQWAYDLQGNLIGVPFRRGVRKQGGMPADFDMKANGLRRLRAEVVNGVVWATFSEATPPFREYLGEKFWRHYTRVYFQSDFRLADPRILDVVQEFPGEDTVGMITVFPSVILQQQVNLLTTRQIIPKRPGGFDFVWTHFCYADDTPEMWLRRTRQANLFGPAGYVAPTTAR